MQVKFKFRGGAPTPLLPPGLIGLTKWDLDIFSKLFGNGLPIILDEPAYFLAGSFFEISEFCLEIFEKNLEIFEKNLNLKMDAREP